MFQGESIILIKTIYLLHPIQETTIENLLLTKQVYFFKAIEGFNSGVCSTLQAKLSKIIH